MIKTARKQTKSTHEQSWTITGDFAERPGHGVRRDGGKAWDVMENEAQQDRGSKGPELLRPRSEHAAGKQEIKLGATAPVISPRDLGGSMPSGWEGYTLCSIWARFSTLANTVEFSHLHTFSHTTPSAEKVSAPNPLPCLKAHALILQGSLKYLPLSSNPRQNEAHSTL